MKLSILITSFNKGKYLEDCIISCLQQDYQDFEVILFDNESNDKSGLILEKYNAQRSWDSCEGELILLIKLNSKNLIYSNALMFIFTPK